jgi:glycerol-3-phosphate acyltransferase PlsX
VTRVAVDVLGGDDAPEVVIAGADRALADDPDLRVLLVGPPQVLGGLAAHPRVQVVPAAGRIGMGDHPVRAVRATPDATVRVAMRQVRDGHADAAVSVGPTGAAMAAALFTIGLLPGVTRAPLAVTVPGGSGPVVIVDAGANVDCSADLLVQFAIAGAAFAGVRHGLDDPRVGLLSIGTEDGKGDALRKQAFDLLGDSPLHFVGNVEPAAATTGTVADVVVTDGFTGNVLLKSIEAMHALARRVVADSPAAVAALDLISPDRGAGVLLGVDGVVAIGHGASGPAAVASCIAAAADAARGELPARVADVMAALVKRRRELAGLS